MEMYGLWRIQGIWDRAIILFVIWITGLCWSSVLYLSSTLINCYLLNICIHVSAKGPNLLCLVSWQYWYLLHRTFSSIQILKIKSITYKGCVNDFRELPTRPGVPTINLPIVAKPGNWFWKTFLNKCLFVCLSILFTTKEVPRIL